MSDISETSEKVVNVWEEDDALQGIVWSDEGSIKQEDESVVPQYLKELIQTITPECTVDLDDEVSVRAFIEKVRIKRVTRKVERLVRLEHRMAPYFEKPDLDAIKHEVKQCMNHLPSEVQKRIVQVVRSDIKFSVLNGAVKDGMLDEVEDRDLFKTIIRHHAQSMK